jgi:hypothetical protein
MRRAQIPVFLLALALSFAVSAPAQSPPLYKFGIDQDNLQGAADFSFLNHTLTPADKVFVKNGHFYTVGADLTPFTDDDQRIRFFGVNLAFGANFPTQEDSVRIAKRLRRLGVNLVRLHHMDSIQDPVSRPSDANGILTTGPYPSFNEISVQRLRDFLTALSAEGVYADLNLHVGYQFRPAVDQVPSLGGLPMPEQGKPLHIFFPRMVELQQQFTQQLIEKLRLKDDPVLGVVEINNESSLMQAWQWGQLDPVLVGDYRAALQQQWNAWLAGKYADTTALKAAWGTGSADGDNLLSGNWTLEQGHGKTGSLSIVQIDGEPTAQVQMGTGTGWLFLKQTGFHVNTGVRYAWTFEAKADIPAGQTANVPITAMRDVSPWDGFLYSSITLTNQWQKFTIAVTPSFDIHDSGRVSLDVEYVPGTVYARRMSLKPAGQLGLAEGESIETGNISLLGPGEGATPARMADYMAFIVATDRNYLNVLRDTLRASTDALVPLTGTQIGFGGLTILDSQDGLDYQDNHFYIDHYSFPNVQWDAYDWRIRDVAAADDGWSSFIDMAWGREAGKPYTVSEFNQPWPNTHSAELDPSLAAYASFQDWDGIMHFAYAHGRNWDDGVPNGFNVNGDWTKFPVIGQSAWLFRTGAVKPSQATLNVPVSLDQRLQAAAASQYPTAWVSSKAGIPKDVAFTRGVQLAKDSADPLPDGATTAPATPYASDTGELTFDKGSGLLLVNAPQAAGVMGRIGRNRVSAGPVDVELASTARGFATVLLTALDNAPISDSGKLLLSVPGYSLRALPDSGNRQPAAATASSQRMVNYPGTSDWWTVEATNGANASRPSGDMNSGYQPTFMERVEAYVTLRTNATAITVSVLDGTGTPVGTLGAADVEQVAGGFRIHLNGDGQPNSPWFAISAVQPAPATLTADPNPIPVTDATTPGQTTLTWSAPGHNSVELRVDAPDGAVVASGGESGSAQTGEWVADGTTFYLVDAATKATLASVVVKLIYP